MVCLYFFLLSGKDGSQPSSLWFIEIECVVPPTPDLCDHSLERCNRCWMGYPQSRFPQWTKQQIRKAKIYDAVHKSPRNKHCICYRVDVNMQGLFTHPREMTLEYGNEDSIWHGMIHEQVSSSHLFLYERSIFLSETMGYTTESLFPPRFVWTSSSDAGHKVSIFFYLPSCA